jgi:phosphinothricin acetyltransferase
MAGRHRRAEPEDAEAIALIYNQGIEDRIATFEVASPGGISGRRGVLRVRRSRTTWRGFGNAALSALIEESESRGYWKLLSRIFVHNEASRRLCESMGFREVGIYLRHAKLDGRWIDCVIVEKLLGEASDAAGGSIST